MGKIELLENITPDLWNAHAFHPLQAYEWGEARQKMGIQVLRIAEYEGDDLKHVFQLTIHKIPYTPFTIGYIPRSTMPSSDVLKFLTTELKRFNTIFVTIEPYVKRNFSDHFPLSTVPFQLKRSAHPLFPTWSQIVDIRKSEDELFKTLKSKTRYNIGLAQRKGAEVKEMSNEQGFEIFSKLYFQTCKRQNYKGHTKHYHKIIFESLKDRVAHILIAFYKDIPLCAYELFHFKDTLYYPYGGSSVEHKDVMASNLLMWEAIRFAKKVGATSFDLWGSLSPNYDHKDPWAGFTRFKEGYNAQFVEFVGSYDLILNTPLYHSFSFLNTIRKKILV